MHQWPSTFQQFVAHWQKRCAKYTPYTDTQSQTTPAYASHQQRFIQPDINATRFRIQCSYFKRYYGKNHSSKLASNGKTFLLKWKQLQQQQQLAIWLVFPIKVKKITQVWIYRYLFLKAEFFGTIKIASVIAIIVSPLFLSFLSEWRVQNENVCSVAVPMFVP